MTSNIGRNVLVLAICWLATLGGGIYLTFVQQPKELEVLERSKKVAQLKEAEVETLLAEAATSEEQAEEVLSRWGARYKVIPAQQSSPEILGYLNDLTQEGFKNFDVSLQGVRQAQDYSYYTFTVEGRGFFSSLYRFIWDIENNRAFYRIDDLELDHIDLIQKDKTLGTDRMHVMVSFHFKLHAYFGGGEGLSAEAPADLAMATEGSVVVVADDPNQPVVPDAVLPERRPDINPFFPVVMEELPPNTYGLVDVESASLAAIVDGKAVFQTESGLERVGVGESVYLGQIVSVDPAQGRVVARLNKGGIIDRIELDLHTGEHYRQALGPVALTPAN